MESLPSEILFHLFAELRWQALSTVAQVCKRLNEHVLALEEGCEWNSVTSTNPRFAEAVEDVIAQINKRAVRRPQVAVLFISSTHGRAYGSLKLSNFFATLTAKLPREITLVGCSGAGIIGTQEDGSIIEIETTPAISLTTMHFPRSSFKAHAWLEEYDFPETLESSDEETDAHLVTLNGASMPSPEVKWKQIYILACPIPFSVDLLQEAFPGAFISGALASASRGAFPIAFSYSKGQGVRSRKGVAALAFTSEDLISYNTVSKGCVGVGEPYTVVEAGRKLIEVVKDSKGIEMTASAAFAKHFDPFSSSSTEFIGIQEKEGEGFSLEGNFNVDVDQGPILMPRTVKVGSLIKFFELSKEDAKIEVRREMERAKSVLYGATKPLGAILFNCNGRASGFYGRPGVTAEIYNGLLKGLPMAGFFGHGEISPFEVLMDSTGNVGTISSSDSVIAEFVEEEAEDSSPTKKRRIGGALNTSTSSSKATSGGKRILKLRPPSSVMQGFTSVFSFIGTKRAVSDVQLIENDETLLNEKE